MKKVLALFSLAAAANLCMANGVADQGSLFGGLRFGPNDIRHLGMAPNDEGAYKRVPRELEDRDYLSSQPKGSSYLVENAIHGCKKTIHGVVDRIRTTRVSDRLNSAALSRELSVRLVVGPVQTREDMLLYQRMLRSGVDIRVASQPVLHNSLICDDDIVMSGVIEPMDDKRVSYGLGLTKVSYENASLAKEQRTIWYKAWGQAAPLEMSTEPGNEHWELFGSDIVMANKAHSEYGDASLRQEYHLKKESLFNYFEIPYIWDMPSWLSPKTSSCDRLTPRGSQTSCQVSE